jgi:putative transposase
LAEWDYGSPGYYFITICTQNRIPWFGEIKYDRITLSPVGELVEQELQNTTKIRKNVRIDAWVVMPNHLHAILVIDENSVETPRRGVSTKNTWRPGTLGTIVNQFKSKCTKRIRAMGCTGFAWQARFYDHIIQKEKELDNIRVYIQENPTKWALDEYYL